MTNKSAEMERLKKRKASGKGFYSCSKVRAEITMLKGLVVEQGRQCGSASRS